MPGPRGGNPDGAHRVREARNLSCVTPSQLLGSWSFTRTIADHRRRSEYRAGGTATFGAEPDGRIRWFEEGRLVWQARSSAFTRTLFLVPPADDNADWSVTFEDGRFFHPWSADEVVHLCGRDTYRGDVDSQTSPDPGAAADCQAGWTLTWRVTGPAKDYTMRTHYQPRVGSRV